ncbi:MAG: DUF4287 domain-containing protein [Anaerolineales bacterium]|nr:MAG: DUF4287 domain-containing protein [Anaerolineales bacterium]
MASPEEQLQTMVNNMPEKTGKSLEKWFKLIKTKGLETHGEIMKLLKGEYGVSHGFANTIAIMYRQQAAGGPSSGDDVQAAYFSGSKAAMQPLYAQIVKAAQALGKDVELAPKKTYMSLRRNKQFGIVQVSSKDRVDLGLILKGVPASGRLEAWGGMCTHRVRLGSAKEFDKQVKDWLKQAYGEA